MSDTNTPQPEESASPLEENAELRMSQMSRRSFLWGAVALAAGFSGWAWLTTQPKETAADIAWPFRRTLEVNEKLARAYFNPARLAPTFPRERASTPRPNGDIGLTSTFDPAKWQLKVVGLQGGTRHLTLDDIKRLERVEMVTELKCIEGWSTVVHWAGARFADFVAAYPPLQRSGSIPEYINMMTPDRRYYVGLDRESALHPQTLLAYEMNGEPLTLEHGAPLRLVIPVKYGIKNIKRIGVIAFTDRRPDDYWAKQGYDWYAGH